MSEPLSELSEDEQARINYLLEEEEDEGAVLAALPNLTPLALHYFCSNFTWGAHLEPLRLALRLPQCERATALSIYWHSEPDFWAGRTEPIPSWGKNQYEIFQMAEARLLADDFTERSIPYDIRAENGGVDSYWLEVEANPHIPKGLKP